MQKLGAPLLARSLAGLLLLAATGAFGAGAPEAALGERIYREGILPSGQPLEAALNNGVRLKGAQAACASCHRRSGFGNNEGYLPIRPISGRYLFQPANAPHPRLAREPAAHVVGLRPAYTEATLAQVLREGRDAAGRTLDGMMPRFQLSDADLASLVAYLKTLGTTPDPGVSDATLHFATVIDAAADPQEQEAMLEILQAFFRDKNAGTRLETERARRAPWDMAREYQAYRKWQLHQWVLQGPPATWTAQLEAYYRAQPVFAVLSGLGADNWQPVHDFCEQSQLPCLFPNVEQPPQQPGQYALYLSRGLAIEAEALAVHWQRSGAAGPVVQIYRDDTADAAAAFRRALSASGHSGQLEDLHLALDAPLDPAAFNYPADKQPASWVLWLKPDDLAALDTAALPPAQIYLSSTLADPGRLPKTLAARAQFTYPYELPQRQANRIQRLHAWLRLKDIPVRDGPLQANTFFAVTMAGMALADMVDDYGRDYFIERIEHGTDNSLSPSAYPRPTLAPGQRHASKGSYIVRLDQSSNQLQAIGDWIVPDLPPP